MSYERRIKTFYTNYVTDEQSAKDIIHPQFDNTNDENRELMCWMTSKYNNRFGDNPQKIADWGCGIGRMMDPFIKTGISIDGFDVSYTMLKVAKQKYPNNDFFEVNSDGSVIVSSEVRQYDLIYSFLVLQHNSNRSMRKKNLESICSKLSENGMVIIQLLFKDGPIVEPHHGYDEDAEALETNSKEDNWVIKSNLSTVFEDFNELFCDVEFSFIEFPHGILQCDTDYIIVTATKISQLFNKIYRTTYL